MNFKIDSNASILWWKSLFLWRAVLASLSVRKLDEETVMLKYQSVETVPEHILPAKTRDP
jgi:hypothetical protein